ncbi:MAG TPA: hypothetical protein DCZ86_00540, partial [Candidatus Moranbacteria bacterium]|nr:hypothetical protein [Candidatus Moranbacteria bacterium]
TTAPGSLFLSTAAPDGGMIIEGNVGIGTTSPVAALAIGSGQIAMPNGTASAPSYSFGAELGSGMYRVGTNTLGFATTGTQRVTIDANGTLNTSDIVAVRNSAEDIKIITLQNNSGDVAAGLNIDFRLRQNFGSYVILDSAYVDVGHEQDWISAGTTNSYLRFGTILAGVLGEKMRITSGGNVGIGTTAPGYKLEVYTGSASGWVVTADGTWGSTSDARLKKNIEPMGSALDQVMALNPVTFNMKGESNSDPAHMGFIAQDVEKIVPELVTAGPNGYKGLSYALFTPLLTKAVQEQQTEISNVQIQMSNQIQNLNDQKLQITKQAGDVTELQTAVNDKLNIISQSLALGEANSQTLGERTEELETKITAAQTRLAEAENNLAAFEASTTDLLASMMETENMITERLLSHEERIKALENKMALMTVSPGGEIPSNIVTLDETGSAEIAGIFKAKEVETGKVAADGVVAGSYAVRNEEDAPTTGDGTIISVKTDADSDGWDDETKVDGKSARVQTKAVSESAKIFVTFEGDPGGRWWVEKITDAEIGKLTDTFSVNVSEAVKKDVKFSWWIVESK